MDRDLEHLRLLSVFHYVLAAMTALFSMFPLLHLALGIGMVSGAFPSNGDPPPPAFVGWLLIGFAGSFILAGLTLALLLLLAARSLARQRRHTFCCAVAGLSCLLVPFGTVLGVFTLIVLLSDSVRERFAAGTG